MKEIPLTGGGCAKVDDADYDELMKHKWQRHRTGCACRRFIERETPEVPGGRKRQRIMRMHRQILDAPVGIEVDHKDGDPLNNQRSNLRLATSSQQKFNTRISRNNKSGVKGVHWDKSRKMWMSYVTKEGKRVTIGRFRSLSAATAARRAVANFIFGEFAREEAA